MAQSKMKFGIDLGTTNSAICKMESGEPVIKKTDTLKDTLPSCVSFTKKKIAKVGDSAYNDLRQDKSRATKNGLMTAKTYSLSLNEIWVRTNRMKVLIWENLFLQSNFLPKF